MPPPHLKNGTHAVEVIALDPGHWSLKLARVNGTEIDTCVLPAEVGIGQDRKRGLGLDGFGPRSHFGRNPVRIAFEGGDFLVGHNVGQFTTPITERTDFDRFTDSPELRAAVYVGLHQIASGQHDLALAIALPVQVVEKRAEALRVERLISGWLKGEHRFQINGQAARFRVSHIRAKTPQPLATWIDWGFNTRGQWARKEGGVSDPALILDQGFNTFDLLVMDKGKISERFSQGDKLGMRWAGERLIEILRSRYRLNLGIRAANELIQAVATGHKAETYLGGELTDVSAEAHQALNTLVADIVTYIDRTRLNFGAYRVFLTGGGILALANRLSQRFPGSIILHEPGLANARGLAKMGMRSGWLVRDQVIQNLAGWGPEGQARNSSTANVSEPAVAV